ncbi:MAG: response regulator [Thermoplasmata archaeon]|nr:response regulator [Thermoplasmata archaeon]
MSRKIMIVDDEEDIHALLKSQLEKVVEAEIISCLSGEEAIEKYQELMDKGERPDLVVMDLNLSGRESLDEIDMHREGLDRKMDGVRTTEKILEMDSNAMIWGYTAWFDTDWAEKLKEEGATKVVARTMPFKEFARMLAAFFEERE